MGPVAQPVFKTIRGRTRSDPLEHDLTGLSRDFILARGRVEHAATRWNTLLRWTGEGQVLTAAAAAGQAG